VSGAGPEPSGKVPEADGSKSWGIEVLSDRHNFKDFTCGQKWLDQYLHGHAWTNQQTGYGRTYLAIDDAKYVGGFYTLSMASVHFNHLPDDLARRVPKYPMPVALIGCLAVDKTIQKSGLGTLLLIDSMQRIVQASEIVAARAVEVLAINDEAKDWYQRFGFLPFKDNPRHLYLPMATAREVVGRSQ